MNNKRRNEIMSELRGAEIWVESLPPELKEIELKMVRQLVKINQKIEAARKVSEQDRDEYISIYSGALSMYVAVFGIENKGVIPCRVFQETNNSLEA